MQPAVHSGCRSEGRQGAAALQASSTAIKSSHHRDSSFLGFHASNLLPLPSVKDVLLSISFQSKSCGLSKIGMWQAFFDSRWP
jgi:hypothetical protein